MRERKMERIKKINSQASDERKRRNRGYQPGEAEKAVLQEDKGVGVGEALHLEEDLVEKEEGYVCGENCKGKDIGLLFVGPSI